MQGLGNCPSVLDTEAILTHVRETGKVDAASRIVIQRGLKLLLKHRLWQGDCEFAATVLLDNLESEIHRGSVVTGNQITSRLREMANEFVLSGSGPRKPLSRAVGAAPRHMVKFA